jgi:uncharacterized membrane protein
MNHLAKQILSLFFQGLLFITPIFIPLYILYSVFDSLDNSFKEWFGLEIPGLGILLVFALLTIVGWLGKTFITQPIRNYFKSLLEKAPLVKVIYNSVSDLLKAFVGKEKKFTKPVLVKLNNISDLEKIGFITQEDLKDFNVSDDKIAVYFPHSYAFSGEMFIVPKSQVTPIDKKSADVMKFIVSAGVSKS